MNLVDFAYAPGTVKTPQHTKLTEAAWTETDMVHFPDGKLTTIPAFDDVLPGTIYSTFTGTCRAQWASKMAGLGGAFYFFGTHSHLFVLYRGTLYNITPLVTSATATLGTDPLALTSGDATMTVTYTAHGLVVGDRIKFSGATHGTGGFATASINVEHIVATVIGANSFTVELNANAPATDATEGGAAVAIYKQIAAGNQYQSYPSGWGAGIWGAGIWGAPLSSVSGNQTYPRIWSFADFGKEVVMCPGDYATGNGQKIYIWDGDTDLAPTVLTNAPTDCNWVMVVNNSVVALCWDSTNGASIEITELGDATVWSGVTTTDIPVQRSWRLISGFLHEEKSAVIFAPEPLLLQYSAGAWDLRDLGSGHDIAAPMACCRMGDGLEWYGRDGNLRYYDGGAIRTIINKQNGEYIRDQMNEGAIWTIFMMQDQKHLQAWMYYPSDDSQDPDAYVIHNQSHATEKNPHGSFTLGTMPRTSAQRPGTQDALFYMTDDTDIFSHFLRAVADFAWSAKSAYAYGGKGDRRMVLHNVMPDLVQEGDVTLTPYSKEAPHGDEITWPSVTLESSGENITITAAGRLLAFELSGGEEFTLGGMKLNIRPQGGRW